MFINIKKRIKEVINEDKIWPLCFKLICVLFSVTEVIGGLAKTLLGKNKNSTLPHFPDDQLCK